jgi:hypothetical protein
VLCVVLCVMCCWLLRVTPGTSYVLCVMCCVMCYVLLAAARHARYLIQLLPAAVVAPLFFSGKIGECPATSLCVRK